MTRRAVRLALFLVFVVAIASTAWFGLTSSRRFHDTRRSLQTADASARKLLDEVAACRTGLQAYVAVGEGTTGWPGRVAQHIQSFKSELARFQELSNDPNATNGLDAAGATFEEFIAINDRVARLVRADQLTDASQVIYGDGLDRLAAVTGHIKSAWEAEQASADSRMLRLEQELGYVAAGAGLVALLVVGLLIPTGRRADPTSTATSMEHVSDSARVGTSLALNEPEHAPAAASTVPAAATEVAPSQPDTASRVDVVPGSDRRKATELKAMAELCTDFARLTDPGELPALFERAARLIDATGFIVWVTDAEGTSLRPALAHGYPASALLRMPAIRRDVDNATAAAWRESAVQVVRTNGMTPGALVVPLLTPTGCIGVFSAEVRHGREASESVRALTRIVAAQIAQLVSIPAAATASTTERESSVV